jgi:hypothetical protein
MVGQANYGAAKAGIAAMTQIVAMEMSRLGVGVNAIAPGARTRMTENTFGDLPPPPEIGSWDPLGPENVAPVVAFLASDASAGITGQVFGVAGGIVHLYQGWHDVAELSKDGPWTPQELAGRIDELFGDRPRSYDPPPSAFRKAAGIAGALGRAD